MPFKQELFEHLLNVERGVMCVLGSEGDVLQIEVHRHGGVGILSVHDLEGSWSQVGPAGKPKNFARHVAASRESAAIIPRDLRDGISNLDRKNIMADPRDRAYATP